TFVLSEEDKDQIRQFQEQARENVDHEVLAGILDYFGLLGNGQYMPIHASDIGALTDSPLLTNGVEHTDDDGVVVWGDIWYFPNYMCESFSDTLLSKGKVTFQKLH